MDGLTPEELSGLASMQLHSLEVSKTPVTAFDVAIKSYVDSKYGDAVTAAQQSITDLINGAPAQLDTLKEISSALGDNANLSGVLVASIASVQSSVTAEAVARATAIQEQANIVNINISSESDRRQLAEGVIVSSIDAEKVLRNNLQVSTDNAINNEVTERVNAIGTLSQNKMDVSPNFTSGGSEGYPKVSEASYLYIGDCWRIRANNLGVAKRLEFQYSPDGLDENFKTAVPFIRA